MSDPSRPVSIDSQRRVDGVCDEFERRLRSGEQPRIEDYLNRVAESRHEGLLKALLDVELELTSGADCDLSLATYQRRFPEFHDAVAHVIAAHADRGQPSDPLASTLDPSRVRRASDTDAGDKTSRRIRCPGCESIVATVLGRGDTTVACPSCGKSFRVRLRSNSGRKTTKDSVPEKIDRYEIRRLLGRGSFGAVYQAWDPRLEREVALKLPHRKFQDEPGFHDRFLREARALAGLQHPGICRIHEVHELQDSRLLLSLAFLNGKPLSSYFSADKPMKAETVARLGSQIASALQTAHDAGILHRDLKPDNILLVDRSRPVVTDFGLARRGEDAALTQTGQILGTPAYMSPEQATGREADLGTTTDIYSLGATLYHMVTGRRPFSGSVPEVLAQVLRDEPRAPSEVFEGLDGAWDDFLLKCLQKRPEDRFGSMAEVAVVLTKLAQTKTAKPGRSSEMKASVQASTRQTNIQTTLSGVHRDGTAAKRKFIIAGVTVAGLAVMGAALSYLLPDSENASEIVSGLPPNTTNGETEPVSQTPEADSPLIGSWKIYSDRLPITGADIEFFASGDVQLSVDSQTVGGAGSEFPLTFETCSDCDDVTSAIQLNVPHGVPSVAGARSTIAAAANSLGTFGLRDGESWCLNMMPSGTLSGWRSFATGESLESAAKQSQSPTQSITASPEPIGRVVLIRMEEDIGPPAIGTNHWLLGAWELGPDQFMSLGEDGGLVHGNSGVITGGRTALGGITEIYRIAQVEPRDGSIQIEVFRKGADPDSPIEKREHWVRLENGGYRMTRTRKVPETRTRIVQVNRELPGGQTVVEEVEQTYTVVVPMQEEIEIRRSSWTADVIVQTDSASSPPPDSQIESAPDKTQGAASKMTAKQMVEQAIDSGAPAPPAENAPSSPAKNTSTPTNNKEPFSSARSPAPAPQQGNDKNAFDRKAPTPAPARDNSRNVPQQTSPAPAPADANQFIPQQSLPEKR